MESPKCRLCSKRHYGVCAVVEEPGPPADMIIFDEASDTPPEMFEPAKKIEATPLSDSDSCPTCGTNLAARRKERERRRKYMKVRRASI